MEPAPDPDATLSAAQRIAIALGTAEPPHPAAAEGGTDPLDADDHGFDPDASAL